MAANAYALAARFEEDIVTRPLRRDHLRIWIVMAIAMLLIFAASIAERRDTTPRNAGIDWSQTK